MRVSELLPQVNHKFLRTGSVCLAAAGIISQASIKKKECRIENKILSQTQVVLEGWPVHQDEGAT